MPAAPVTPMAARTAPLSAADQWAFGTGQRDGQRPGELQGHRDYHPGTAPAPLRPGHRDAARLRRHLPDFQGLDSSFWQGRIPPAIAFRRFSGPQESTTDHLSRSDDVSGHLGVHGRPMYPQLLLAQR
jgi:hypothetical protein